MEKKRIRQLIIRAPDTTINRWDVNPEEPSLKTLIGCCQEPGSDVKRTLLDVPRSDEVIMELTVPKTDVAAHALNNFLAPGET